MKCQNVLKFPFTKRRVPRDWNGQEGLWRMQNLWAVCQAQCHFLAESPLSSTWPSLSSANSVPAFWRFSELSERMFSYHLQKNCSGRRIRPAWSQSLGFWSLQCIAVMCSLGTCPLFHGTVSYPVSPARRTEQNGHEGWLLEWCASMVRGRKIRSLHSCPAKGCREKRDSSIKKVKEAEELGVSHQRQGRARRPPPQLALRSGFVC